MFCYQCEQTAKGTGCTQMGVCGKDDATSGLQDLLVYAAQGVSNYAHRAKVLGASDIAVDIFVVEALFATVTNVDFDTNRLTETLYTAAAMRDKAKKLYEDACAKAGKTPETLSGPAQWVPATDLDGLLKQAAEVGILSRKASFGDDIAGLLDLILFGLKGTAAYADHAHVLGFDDDAIYGKFHEYMDYMTNASFGAEDLTGKALAVGELNLKVMELLDKANTTAYGDPTPVKVRVEPIKGKAILVSGHDLLDLEHLLKQTEGKGINIYTHGEMLPAHGYPKLKAYKHLVGNYGGAWQDQWKEFDAFPGAILMTGPNF